MSAESREQGVTSSVNPAHFRVDPGVMGRGWLRVEAIWHSLLMVNSW